MLTIIVGLVLAAAVTFLLMKAGKVADKNNNNIPDALEHAAAEVKEEVKEVVEKVKKTATKKKATKKKDA